MRAEGFVKSWDADRGNGWLEVIGAREPVFIHVKDVRGRDPLPVPGQRVSLDLSYNWEGRARARDVKLLRGHVALSAADDTGQPSTQQDGDVAVASTVQRAGWLSRLLGRGSR